nr:integration host factor subunit beta [Desulfobacterales bacterium]
MVKRGLISALKTCFPEVRKKDIALVVNTMFETMANALIRGETVDLRGIGRFEVKERKPIRIINPRSKDPLLVPRRWTVRFRPADSLKKRIQG